MMSTLSLGDLAQSYLLQRRGAALKSEMTQLSQELATGQVSDKKAVLAGNVSIFADLENSLQTLKGYTVATAEAVQFADATQIALERIQNVSSTLGASVLRASSSGVEAVIDQVSTDAVHDLSAVVSALNTKHSGRTLFAGVATDQAAIAGAKDILADARAIVSGTQTPVELVTALDDWIGDPSGFSATAYLGSDDTLEPFRLSDSETASLSITANDDGFRDVVRNLILTAVAADAGFGFSVEDKKAILSEAGIGLQNDQNGLTSMRASVGATQARIDAILARNAAEETSLSFAKGALLQADPYETATKLEEVQFQLQSLYTVTARMSDLSLVNFIR